VKPIQLNSESLFGNQATNRRSANESQPVPVEWAQINDHHMVVVTKDRNWILVLDKVSGRDPFAEPMSGPGDKATTRQLLDAAWSAGMEAGELMDAPISRSLPRYVRELVNSYFLTSATPKLLREMAGRFHDMGRHDLAMFARHFARLEDGDLQMAADDLRCLGYDAAELVTKCEPSRFAITLRDYFTALVRGPQTIEALGYVYAIERSSLSITAQDLREFGSILPAGVKAMTCRRHHSGVGGDVAHVRYFLHACSRLPGPDRALIARATYEAMKFISGIPTDDGIEDDVLERQYARFRVASPNGNPVEAYAT
jgi:hypothetical protein